MRYWLWLAAGFALYKLSGVLEGIGDLAPYADSGVSWERLMFHGTALALLLAGLACFVRVLVLAWRSLRGGGESRKIAAAFDVEAPAEFDPDAALARYLETRDAKPAAADPITRPRPGGFGRRGL